MSFIYRKLYKRYFKQSEIPLQPTYEKFKSLNDKEIEVLGSIITTVKLESFGNDRIKILLHVVNIYNFGSDLIIGRDLLAQEKIDFHFPAGGKGEVTNLFCTVLTVLEAASNSRKLEDIFESLSIDFDREVKNKLIKLILKIENSEVPLIEDDHSVRVNLKDTSTYAYAPRWFALTERKEIQEIVDDLLQRGIIKPSVSLYCARVVPIRKRNNSLHLCVHLRPLNEKVLKQIPVSVN